MNCLQEKQRIQAGLKARKIRLNLVKDQYNKLQLLAESLAIENFRDEEKIYNLNEQILRETPTLATNFKALLIALLLPVFAFSQDTIHVKKVFLNGHAIKVKSSYIVHKSNNTWEVNGKEVMLWAVKETDKADFKPQTLTAKK